MKHALQAFLITAFVLLLTACGQGSDTASEIIELRDACQLQTDPGPCKARMEKFYFDPQTNACAVFYYGGCQGTVPFDTPGACKNHCESEQSAIADNQCEFEGISHPVGDSWARDCNTCACTQTENGPSVVCTEIACNNNVAELNEDIDTYPYTVTLKFGESINTNDGEITFLDINEDNRCPEGVDCVWEGNAKVTVMLENEDQPPIKIQVDTLESTEYKRTILINDRVLQLKTLNPTPKADRAIENNSYGLELKIEQKTF